MTRDKIYVVTAGSLWKVKCDHCGEETCLTQDQALRKAKQHIAGLSAGTLSQILIQGRDSKFRAEWTYGDDPFPPRG